MSNKTKLTHTLWWTFFAPNSLSMFLYRKTEITHIYIWTWSDGGEFRTRVCCLTVSQTHFSAMWEWTLWSFWLGILWQRQTGVQLRLEANLVWIRFLLIFYFLGHQYLCYHPAQSFSWTSLFSKVIRSVYLKRWIVLFLVTNSRLNAMLKNSIFASQTSNIESLVYRRTTWHLTKVWSLVGFRF